MFLPLGPFLHDIVNSDPGKYMHLVESKNTGLKFQSTALDYYNTSLR